MRNRNLRASPSTWRQEPREHCVMSFHDVNAMTLYLPILCLVQGNNRALCKWNPIITFLVIMIKARGPITISPPDNTFPRGTFFPVLMSYIYDPKKEKDRKACFWRVQPGNMYFFPVAPIPFWEKCGAGKDTPRSAPYENTLPMNSLDML